MITFKSRNTFLKYVYASILHNLLYDRKFLKFFILFITLIYIVSNFSFVIAFIDSNFQIRILFSFFIGLLESLFLAAFIYILLSITATPVIRYLAAKRNNMIETEFFFDTDIFGYKSGAYSISLKKDILKEIHFYKKYILIRSKHTVYFLFPDKKEREILLRSLSASSYKELVHINN